MYCFYVAAVALLLVVACHSFISVTFIVRFVSFVAVWPFALGHDTQIQQRESSTQMSKDRTNNGILFLMFTKLAFCKY